MRGRLLRVVVAALVAAVPAEPGVVVPTPATAATGDVLFVVASPSGPGGRAPTSATRGPAG